MRAEEEGVVGVGAGVDRVSLRLLRPYAVAAEAMAADVPATTARVNLDISEEMCWKRERGREKERASCYSLNSINHHMPFPVGVRSSGK